MFRSQLGAWPQTPKLTLILCVNKMVTSLGGNRLYQVVFACSNLSAALFFVHRFARINTDLNNNQRNFCLWPVLIRVYLCTNVYKNQVLSAFLLYTFVTPNSGYYLVRCGGEDPLLPSRCLTDGVIPRPGSFALSGRFIAKNPLKQHRGGSAARCCLWHDSYCVFAVNKV